MIVQVPLESLRLPGIYPGATGPDGSEAKDISPEVNDPVSFSIEGVVTAISGNTADIEVRLINGDRPGRGEYTGPASRKPAAKAKSKSKAAFGPATDAPDDLTEAEMETAARQADEEEYA